MKTALTPLLLCLLLATGGCRQREPQTGVARNGAFAKAKNHTGPNLQRIIDSGELIVTTVSGPDTYFDYQGAPMGVQYALAEHFASTLGVAVRVLLCNDTTEVVQQLKSGEADVAALQLPDALCQTQQLHAAGASHAQQHTSWAVRQGADDLAEALDEWYAQDIEQNVAKQERSRLEHRHTVRRTVRSPFISREKGIISTYDNLFRQAAHTTGWDWRLIAAQCYQESGFDPNAVSWAGAKGLMQIMPATARHLNLPPERIFEAAPNMEAAARYIRELQGHFTDIRDPEERVKFVLASYNGGVGHINDAQALARKHGGSPHRWADVGHYVKGLSSARYYRDPVVRHGYMIGSETFNYVENIMLRWKQYGGDVRSITSSAGTPLTESAAAARHEGNERKPHKKNRYSREHKILTPEEMKETNL